MNFTILNSEYEKEIEYSNLSDWKRECQKRQNIVYSKAEEERQCFE